MTNQNSVYSVGHSTHSFSTFLALVRDTHITAIADVRSAPYSRRCPQFNREALQRSLNASRVAYVFMGNALGGRGTSEAQYDEHGRVQYRYLANSAAFRQGLLRVRRGSERMRLALMCAESDPLDCHRCILIGRLLFNQGTPVVHVHADGRLEAHREAEGRLVRSMGHHQPELFQSEDQILSAAYDRQEERIAYVRPNSSEVAVVQ